MSQTKKITGLLCTVFFYSNVFCQNVGIGTSTPSAKLDVNGDMKVATNVAVGGTVTMDNKGLLYNAGGNAKLRYFTTAATFNVVNLASHGITSDFTVSFTGFTNSPLAMVGNIVITGGTTGTLYKCQLVLFDVTASGCKARVSNTSNTTINQTITWNIVCVGEGS